MKRRRDRLKAQLAAAKRRVEEAQRMAARQKERIGRRQIEDLDTAEAERLLARYERTVEFFENEQRLIEEKLGALEDGAS